MGGHPARRSPRSADGKTSPLIGPFLFVILGTHQPTIARAKVRVLPPGVFSFSIIFSMHQMHHAVIAPCGVR